MQPESNIGQEATTLPTVTHLYRMSDSLRMDLARISTRLSQIQADLLDKPVPESETVEAGVPGRGSLASIDRSLNQCRDLAAAIERTVQFLEQLAGQDQKQEQAPRSE